MSRRTPRTHSEALEGGGKHMSPAEVAAIPAEHLDSIARLIDGGHGPGSYCNETACIGGKKYVIYRDDTGGCTRYVKMDC